MNTIAVILDSCPPYLATDAVSSLLLAPVGTGTVLEGICAALEPLTTQAPVILPSFVWNGAYAQAVHAAVSAVQLVPAAAFGDFLDQHERADMLLLVDPRYFAPGALPQLLAAHGASCPAATRHLLTVARQGSIRERVRSDVGQRVRAVERLYDGVTRVAGGGVVCSLISVAAARCLNEEGLASLHELRLQLAACGVPSVDTMLRGAAHDLTRADGLLALNERWLLRTPPGVPRGAYRAAGDGVWLGPGCRLHPRCRIHGPVVLHAGVSVEEDALIVGPSVLAGGARVGAGAVVAHSVLGAKAIVTPGAIVQQQVVPPGREIGAGAGLEPGPWTAPTAAPDGNDESDAADAPRGGAAARLAERAKRAADFAAALLGLIVLAPLLALLAAAVKLTSRGPVFFGHEREGWCGRTFHCWKFRTMVETAHAQQRGLYAQNAVDGPQFKLERDPRITPLGRVLRATNLDELPQLYNVLCGDMSLVGPRPSPFRENQVCVPWRRARLSVRPGITGLWQVCRNERTVGDFHQWIMFDMLYVRHFSLGLDVRILMATMLTLGGRWNVPLGWMLPRLAGRDRRAVEPGRSRATVADDGANAATRARVRRRTWTAWMPRRPSARAWNRRVRRP